MDAELDDVVVMRLDLVDKSLGKGSIYMHVGGWILWWGFCLLGRHNGRRNVEKKRAYQDTSNDKFGHLGIPL